MSDYFKLTFLDEIGEPLTLKVFRPNASVLDSDVISTMNGIIASDALRDDNKKPVSSKEATLYEKQYTQITV